MIVLLLLLIVLILLFGAGAVKGWLGGFALRLGGAFVLLLAFVILTLWLGENGVWLAMGGLVALVLLLKVIIDEPASLAKATKRRPESDASRAEWDKPEVRFSEGRLSKSERKLRKNKFLDR